MTESTLLGLTLTSSGLSEQFPLVKALTLVPLSPQKKYLFLFLQLLYQCEKMVRKLILYINDLCSYGQINSGMQQHTFTVCCSKMSSWWSSSQWNLCPLRTSGTTQNIWHLEAGGLCLLWQCNCCSDYLQLKTFGLLGLVKPQSFAQRNGFLSSKYSLRMGHLWTFPCSTDILRRREVLEDNSACMENRNRQARFRNLWKRSEHIKLSPLIILFIL